LLHAISKRQLGTVRIIIDHPKYSSEVTQLEKSKIDATVYAQQKYQYSPDITPLMLAAHMYAIVVFHAHAHEAPNRPYNTTMIQYIYVRSETD